MASFKALCLVGVASLVATTYAHAADLFTPPPAPIYQPPPPVEFGGGWYLRGDAGVGTTVLSDASSTFSSDVPNFAHQGFSLDEQAVVDLGVGYQINQYFRADVTGEYHFGANYHSIETATGCNGAGGPCADSYGGKISNAVFLANGYVDLGTWHHATPYFGAGVGVAINRFNGLTDYNLVYYGASSGSASASSNTSLAYAFMAGIAYDLTPNLKLDVGYRYLDMGHIGSNPIVCNQNPCPYEKQSFHLASNEVRVGLRYSFTNLVPYAPSVPVIARY